MRSRERTERRERGEQKRIVSWGCRPEKSKIFLSIPRSHPSAGSGDAPTTQSGIRACLNGGRGGILRFVGFV